LPGPEFAAGGWATAMHAGKSSQSVAIALIRVSLFLLVAIATVPL
jgi:hypothetical protein